MNKSDKISAVFSKCLTSLCLAVFETEDRVIRERLNQFVNKLLISFISFKNKKENQSSFDANVVHSDHVVQHKDCVAQYNHDIFFAQIDGMISYLELLSHLKKIKTTSPLLAVKNMLFLKISILNSQRSQIIVKKEIKPKEKQEKSEKINGLAEKIFDFISKSEQPPDNKAIFSNFSKTSIRTLRRHIKALLIAKAIKRHQSGKTVTYTMSQ